MNSRPADYESAALPLSYAGSLNRQHKKRFGNRFYVLRWNRFLPVVLGGNGYLLFIRLKDQFPGTLKEDKFPAVIFAGATATLGVVPGIIHISYELGLVAETGWPIVGRRRAFPHRFHKNNFATGRVDFSSPTNKKRQNSKDQIPTPSMAGESKFSSSPDPVDGRVTEIFSAKGVCSAIAGQNQREKPGFLSGCLGLAPSGELFFGIGFVKLLMQKPLRKA